jgi:hypothetical protein
MDSQDLRASVARGRAIAVTSGWTAVSGASKILARTAGFLARRSGQLASALRVLRQRLSRAALQAEARARVAPPAVQPVAEVLADATLADATVVMALPPVVPGLPRVPPPPGAPSTAKLPPPPPRSRRTEGSLRS